MTRKYVAPPGKKYIFRPYITDPNGRKRYASWYGKRVFAILVDVE